MKKIGMWIFVLAMLLPSMVSSQTNSDEEKFLLQKTFEEYKEAILQGKFEVVWDFLLPQTHKQLEQVHQKIKSDPDFREEFSTTNWYGKKVDLLKFSSGKDIYLTLARLAEEGKADAYGEEFGEVFKAGSTKRVSVYEVKWVPALKRYVGGVLDSEFYQGLERQDRFLEGEVIYQLSDMDEVVRHFINIRGKWKLIGSPVYIWLSEDKQLDPLPEHFGDVYRRK